MLILSRKSNESIVIGDHIRITIASVRGQSARIGIEAPAEVGIFREELCASADTVPTPDGSTIRRRILASGNRCSVVNEIRSADPRISPGTK